MAFVLSARRRGFTLIELLTVVVIVGILAAVVVPRFLEQREAGEDAHTANLVSVSYQDAKAFWARQTYPNYGATAALVTHLDGASPEIDYTALSGTSLGEGVGNNTVGIYTFDTASTPGAKGSPDSVFVAARSDSGEVISITDAAGDETKCGFPGVEPCAQSSDPGDRGEDVPVTNTALPTISDTSPETGQTLTSTTGSWSGEPTEFSYQWQAESGGTWSDATGIGAQLAVYRVAFGDLGKQLRVCVTAERSGTTAQACSLATDPVVLGPTPAWLPTAIAGGGPSSDLAYEVGAFPDGSTAIAASVSGSASFGATSVALGASDDVVVAKVSADGTWGWVATGGGPNWDAPEGLATLPDGSVIITGQFSGTATFGETTLTSAGGMDIFVAKVNSDGTWAWAISGGGTGTDAGYELAAFSDGSSVITGSVSGTASFDGTSVTAAGAEDVVIARVTAAGDWGAVTSGGGSGVDRGYAVTARADGSAVVSGYVTGGATFGATSLTTAGEQDIFVARVGADGAFAWAVSAGGGAGDYGQSISTLDNGAMMVVGSFSGTATFATGPSPTSLTSSGGSDAFVARIEPDGSWAWATRAGSANGDRALGVAATPDGGALVNGDFRETASFGSLSVTSAGSLDAYVAKISADGAWGWVYRAGGSGIDFSYSIAVLYDGTAVLTGHFATGATFGPSTITAMPSGYDIYVAKISGSGTWGG